MKDSPACIRWIRDEIRAADAYRPSALDVGIKLDAMESPYGFSKDLRIEWLLQLSDCDLNRYPDKQDKLRERLVSHFKLPSDCALLMGNGSDELLQIVAMSVSGHCLLSVTPDFSMYPIIARNCGLRHVGVPLADGFSLDAQAALAAIEKHRPAAVWLSCPNNPTGKVWDERQLMRIIRHAPGMVLIDEAYAAYSDSSYLDRLAEFDNLLIMRTFSKVGLAGLRFGVLLGRKELIAELDKLRLPYNINALTQSSMRFALEHMAHLNDAAEIVKEERKRLYRGLIKTQGVIPIESRANFILMKFPTNATKIYRKLCEHDILAKHFPNDPALREYLRVTVGTPEENDIFIDTLAAVIQRVGSV